MKWIGLLAAGLLVIACFLPWVNIEYKNLQLTGLDTTGTNFGKPAYFHFLMAAFFLVCTFTERVWAKRLNLLVTAVNLAWAVRNFFVLAFCAAGECPTREIGLWLMLLSSLVMLVTALFPSMKISAVKHS